MGQGSSFCWECGRFNVHHARSRNNPANLSPSSSQTVPSPPQEEDVEEPELSKQRCVRTCLTVWVAILGSIGLIGIILAIFFVSQIRNTLNPSYRTSLQNASIACGAVGGAFALFCIILSITWCSMSCCCKKRWICACCGRQ